MVTSFHVSGAKMINRLGLWSVVHAMQWRFDVVVNLLWFRGRKNGTGPQNSISPRATKGPEPALQWATILLVEMHLVACSGYITTWNIWYAYLWSHYMAAFFCNNIVVSCGPWRSDWLVAVSTTQPKHLQPYPIQKVSVVFVRLRHTFFGLFVCVVFL